MNKRKIMILALSICMVAILAVGGSLAYLTDKDNETNVFTVGNIDIDLIESQYYPQVDTEKTLDDVVADSETYNKEDGYLDVNGENMVPGRWVRKAPYVINTGKNAAYVRIRLEMDKELWDRVEVMFNSTEITDHKNIIADLDETTDPITWTFTYVDPIQPNTDDETCEENMTPFAPVWQFRIMEHLDNKELKDFQNGVENEINFYAEAIQAEGFKTAKEAFAAYDQQMANKQPAEDDKANG